MGETDMKKGKRLRLPSILGNGMVLQRDVQVKIWGWSEPNTQVTVDFLGHSYETLSNSDGKWLVMLEKHEAGGPYKMEIYGAERITLHDIYVGDVWILSGQSNMQLPLERVKDKYPDIIQYAGNPYIRQFCVGEHYDFNEPYDDVQDGIWEAVGHDTILRFSAVGFFFARRLYETYCIPIGLIQTAVGGAHIEAWMSRESLNQDPEALKTVDRFRNDEFATRLSKLEDNREKRWRERLDRADMGLQTGNHLWSWEACDDSCWKTVRIPSYWTDEGIKMRNGAIWFRKDFILPADLAGKPARLFVGRIVDADFTYLNGRSIGMTSYRYPPRKYDIPAGLLKAGKNTIAIRVICYRGKGGFITGKPYKLLFGNRTIDLTGRWKCRVGAAADPLPDKTFLHQIPTGLFYGMLSPISKYGVRGVAWYQGESNTSRPGEYKDLFIRLIRCWREQLKNETLPFLFVQLPNYVESENIRAAGQWPLLREAQLETWKEVPNTAMAVTIDSGEWNDLHPLNKEDVGERLALAARKVAYGENITAMGPVYQEMKPFGRRLILSFSNVGTGLMSKDGEELRNFEIAGEDGTFHGADAWIEGGRVIVSSDKVKKPTAVRYAWSDNPQKINFYNKEGLPASPFRTK